jgi:hypothetical protein
MKRKFKVGSKFKLSADALDNYGSEYAGKVFTVRQWFDHHVKVSVHLPENDPHGHPGFDEGAGSALYEAEELRFALYEWEMEAA